MGEERMMRVLSEGRETTMTAVHISAVHHRSGHCQHGSNRGIWTSLTARRIVDAIVCCRVDDKASQTYGHGYQTQRKHPAKSNLLALAQLETIDYKER